MHMVVLVHIIGGGLGLVAGVVALYAAKGDRLHRESGMVFVCAMLTMSLTGAAIAAFTGVDASVIAGLQGICGACVSRCSSRRVHSFWARQTFSQSRSVSCRCL